MNDVVNAPRPLIPQANPHANACAHAAAIEAAIARVLASGRYVLGVEVAAFERELASFLGAPHAIGVGNGTDAVELALRAAVPALSGAHEVVTVSHTAVATVAAIERAGARPVLVDVEPRTLTMDVDALERAIGPDTRAVVVVHIYGMPAAIERIAALCAARGIALIEDCAQACGARVNGRAVGTFGDAAAFSFYPTKNLGALGDGGAVVTTRDEVAARARQLREYGWRERYISDFAGMNSRLDELQAAILRAKLPALARENERRAAIAAVYDDALLALAADGAPSAPGIVPAQPVPPAGVVHAHHLYVVRATDRDAVRKRLTTEGVGTLIHYPAPVHAQPAYAGRVLAHAMPHTEAAAREVLSLPLWPELTDEDVARVAAAVRAAGQ